MQSCLAAVKTSMLVIQRSQETISTALQAEQNDCKLEETLSSLLGCYIHILTDGKKNVDTPDTYRDPVDGNRPIDLCSCHQSSDE